MPEIKTVYLISHVHTDIGYADFAKRAVAE